MSSKSSPPVLTWKIMLDRPREIRWSNRALYRLQTLPGGFDPDTIDDAHRHIATICDFIWAMLETRDRLPSPEDVADILPLSQATALEEIMRSVSAAIAHGNKGTEEKNVSAGPSLTPGTSQD